MIKEVLESLTSFHFRRGCVKVLQDGRIVAVVAPELWQHFSERNSSSSPLFPRTHRRACAQPLCFTPAMVNFFFFCPLSPVLFPLVLLTQLVK